MMLSPEEAPLCLSGFSSCWLAQYSGASNTQNHSLGVAKHYSDLVAAWALHIHEVGQEQDASICISSFHPPERGATNLLLWKLKISPLHFDRLWFVTYSFLCTKPCVI